MIIKGLANVSQNQNKIKNKLNENIKQLCGELKEMVSIYRTDKFLGDMTSSISVPKFALSQGLLSPLREILYLCNLHLTSSLPKGKKEKLMYSQNDWEEMITKVNQIQSWYKTNVFKNPPKSIEDHQLKLISLQSFLNYFNQGPLNYPEQIIERIERYFDSFSDYIEVQTGNSLESLLDITKYLMEVPNRFLDKYINHKDGEITFREFALQMKEKKIIPPEWDKHMSERLKMQFQFRQDAGLINTFSENELTKNFNKQSVDNFLNLFLVERNNTDFLFYSQKNQMLNKSIFKREDGDFQFFKRELLPLNLFNTLQDLLMSDNGKREKYLKKRGIKLEKKVAEIFIRHFGDELEYYESYYTDKGNEQDLIFFYDNVCLIVEVKSSKLKEPRRDPDKAYELIKTNFDEVIDKGYDQAFRVKEYFLDKADFKIYKDSKLQTCLKEVKARKYPHHFSIVVTLERFGGIQCDLSQMLELYDDDTYPWSVTIDDLESFLLVLNKEKVNNGKLCLRDFLYIRQRIHGKIFTDDESDIIGAYLKGKLKMSTQFKNKKIFPPGDMEIFDLHYQKKGGIGFDNEIGIEKKNSNNTIILG